MSAYGEDFSIGVYAENAGIERGKRGAEIK